MADYNRAGSGRLQRGDEGQGAAPAAFPSPRAPVPPCRHDLQDAGPGALRGPAQQKAPPRLGVAQPPGPRAHLQFGPPRQVGLNAVAVAGARPGVDDAVHDPAGVHHVHHEHAHDQAGKGAAAAPHGAAAPRAERGAHPGPARPASQPRAPPPARRAAGRSGRRRSRESHRGPPPPPLGNERAARRGPPAAQHTPAALRPTCRPGIRRPAAASGSRATRRKWARRAASWETQSSQRRSRTHARVRGSSHAGDVSCRAVLPACLAGSGFLGLGLGLWRAGLSRGERDGEGHRLVRQSQGGGGDRGVEGAPSWGWSGAGLRGGGAVGAFAGRGGGGGRVGRGAAQGAGRWPGRGCEEAASGRGIGGDRGRSG